MRKIIFVNRFFYPDHSATSQMLSDLAFGLIDELDNTEIHIVTSRQRYDDPNALLEKNEIINNVSVHRIWTSNFGRKSLSGRAIDYLSFYFSSAVILLKLTTKEDVIVAKTDPPMISLIAAIVARFKQAHLINWLQDLFPEVAAKLGVRFVRGYPYKLLKIIRNKALNQARMNVAIGNLMAERLQKEGISKEKIAIIHNWADEDKIRPVPHDQNPLRKVWGLEGKFVVGYSGNLGRSHDFSTIISAAETLKDNGNINFLFIGGGAQLPDIKQECLKKGLINVIFKPYQPKEKLAESLSASDIHLISLKPELEGLIVPSKFYGILAVGRPVIFIGHCEGELAVIIHDKECGQVVVQGDACHLTSSIVQEAKQTDQTDRIVSIRKSFKNQFSKTRAIKEFIGVLNGI